MNKAHALTTSISWNEFENCATELIPSLRQGRWYHGQMYHFRNMKWLSVCSCVISIMFTALINSKHATSTTQVCHGCTYVSVNMWKFIICTCITVLRPSIICFYEETNLIHSTTCLIYPLFSGHNMYMYVCNIGNKRVLNEFNCWKVHTYMYLYYVSMYVFYCVITITYVHTYVPFVNVCLRYKITKSIQIFLHFKFKPCNPGVGHSHMLYQNDTLTLGAMTHVSNEHVEFSNKHTCTWLRLMLPLQQRFITLA